MKKNYLYILAAATIFAACSNGDNFDEIKGGDNTPSVPVEDSEIEVVFGKATTATVEQSKTRAALEESWNGERIAIWGVDRSGAAQWNSATSHIFKQTAPVTATVASGGNVNFENGPYYYPMSSNVNYSFYSCYPVTNNFQVSTRSITCSYTIDGKTDIMWGDAVCLDGEGLDGTVYSGFNAQYFRKVVGAQTPNLQFKHCLSRLDFVVTKGRDGGGTTVPVAVKDIKVMEVPTSASLKVIGTDAGVLTEGDQTGNLSLYKGDDPAFADMVTPELGKETPVGTVLLMPSKSRSYKLSVTLEALNEQGEPTGNTDTGTITITSTGDFAAHTKYKVILIVYGLQVVDIRATMLPWAEGDDIYQEVN